GIPFFIALAQSIKSFNVLNKIQYIYSIFFIVIYSLITTAELGIYPDWQSKLNMKALLYLRHPGEVYNSAPTGDFFILLFILLAQIALFIFAYRKWFHVRVEKVKFRWYFSLLWLVLVPGILFTGIRGGYSAVAINQSDSYYSSHQILNLASMNSGYNLLQNAIENQRIINGGNPFDYFPMQDAKKTVAHLYDFPKDSVVHVLNTDTPNVVIIVLESWSADIIGSISGDTGYSPYFAEWEKEGILFTNCISSGMRSEQGLPAIFSGFPAIPYTGITNHHDKFARVPTITKLFKEAGYFSSFFFGGQLMYGNIKGYMYHNGFENIEEESDMPKSAPTGKLGVHDEFMFPYFADKLSGQTQPFFSGIFSVSTHSPYDMPTWQYREFGTTTDDYLNGVLYTDSCIGVFVEKAKKESWYENTLFVIVGDHSHPSQKGWSYYDVRAHRIPLLFTGGAIKPEFRNTKISKLVMQTDIPASILSQVGWDNSSFIWSRDMLNPDLPDFAYFEAHESVGWIRPAGYFVYERQTNHDHIMDIPEEYKDSILREGKSFQQVLYQYFLDL
ncbi:MAG: LTA synthase family protein, partial [Bacteroidetes bacterium]|nr:LTA synthase family protein [Bacteroidota bacterium]